MTGVTLKKRTKDEQIIYLQEKVIDAIIFKSRVKKEIFKDLRQFVRLTYAGSPGVLEIEAWATKKEKELGL